MFKFITLFSILIFSNFPEALQAQPTPVVPTTFNFTFLGDGNSARADGYIVFDMNLLQNIDCPKPLR